MRRLDSLPSIFADEPPLQWIPRYAPAWWAICKPNWCTTFSKASLAEPAPTCTPVSSMAVPIITKSNPCSKPSRAPYARHAGKIPEWPTSYQAPRVCYDDRDCRLRRRKSDLGEEGAGLFRLEGDDNLRV